MKKIIVFLILTIAVSCTEEDLPKDGISGSKWIYELTPQMTFLVLTFDTERVVSFKTSSSNNGDYTFEWRAIYEIEGSTITLSIWHSPYENGETLTGTINDGVINIEIYKGKGQSEFLRQ